MKAHRQTNAQSAAPPKKNSSNPPKRGTPPFFILPLNLYADTAKGKEKALWKNLYYILHDEPNREQTSFEFIMMMNVFLLLWNRAYAEIVYNNAGQVVALWPLSPWRVEEMRTKEGDKFYEVTLPDDTVKKIEPNKIFCLTGVRMALDDTTSIVKYFFIPSIILLYSGLTIEQKTY